MRLLVCDDDPAVGKLLRSIYTVEGWQIDVVTSGRACIAMVADALPDVIVLDHMMPELTGIETARLLRQEGYTKPIVLFSAYLGPDLEDEARDLNLMPVSKIDTQAVVRIIDVLGGMPHQLVKH
jgi:CheY-like chemotaxis protein